MPPMVHIRYIQKQVTNGIKYRKLPFTKLQYFKVNFFFVKGMVLFDYGIIR